ncbi:MAG: sigma-70 family RNA polymerase sigma factor [Acidimicrobiales bacterium]
MTIFDGVSDATLVVAIGRWQEAALAEIYRRHGAAVHNLATRVLGSPHLADEVTQEVFVDLWNRPEQFDAGRGSLRTLLVTKAHGRAVDVVRAEVARTSREQRSVLEQGRGGYDLDHYVWDLAIADQVKGAVEALPAAERIAIEMAYYEGMTYRQVAEVLATPEGTIKTRIRSGLRRLRGGLIKQGVEAP